MRPLILAAVAVLISSCSPMTGASSDPAMDAPVRSADASSCAARGGEMRRVGRMQTEQCILKYADAGKRCTDGDQCAGDCRAQGAGVSTDGSATAGVCQADSDRFGCYTLVEDGKTGATLCID